MGLRPRLLFFLFRLLGLMLGFMPEVKAPRSRATGHLSGGFA